MRNDRILGWCLIFVVLSLIGLLVFEICFDRSAVYFHVFRWLLNVLLFVVPASFVAFVCQARSFSSQPNPYFDPYKFIQYVFLLSIAAVAVLFLIQHGFISKLDFHKVGLLCLALILALVISNALKTGNWGGSSREKWPFYSLLKFA